MGDGNEGPFLEFFAIAFIAPAVAGLVAIVTSRLGSAGKLRKLELIQKELEVTTEMLSKSNIDDEFKDLLRENVRSLAGDLAYLHGADVASATDDIADRSSQVFVPKPWSEYSKVRRYLFPPGVWTINGIISITLFYILLLYFSFGMALVVVGPFSDEGAELSVVGLSIATFTYVVFMLPTSFWVRSAYRRRRLQLLERQRAISR